jgi:hypothetical protein
MVLRHAAGDVRVMMLHADLALGMADPRAPCGCSSSRDAVVGDGARRDAEEVLQAGERLLEELHGLEVFQVADVLAEDGVAALGQAEGVLQFAAEGEHLVQLDAEVDGLGDEAARAPQHAFAAFEGADDGIVHAGPDVAVVQQKPVGDAVELAQGLALETTMGSSLRLPLVITSAGNSESRRANR